MASSRRKVLTSNCRYGFSCKLESGPICKFAGTLTFMAPEIVRERNVILDRCLVIGMRRVGDTEWQGSVSWS